MPTLVALALNQSVVTDEGVLQVIKRLPTLRQLGLIDTKVTEKILASLFDFEILRLDGLPITDAGLKVLHAAKQLKQLTLLRTKVTATGLKGLRTALPLAPPHWPPPGSKQSLP